MNEETKADYKNWERHIDLVSDDIKNTLLQGFEKIKVGFKKEKVEL